jgi:hypothetical protein
MSVDWRELWRLRLAQGIGTSSSAEPRPADTDHGEADTVRTRFFFVVARTRLDLFLTIRRQFRDDRTVYVMLDRREQDRRSRTSAVDFPDRRRRADRRRPMDYWEDTAHHPAVLIPLSRLRPDSGEGGTFPPPQTPEQDKEPTMEPVLVDQARVLAWVQEGQHVLQHVLPAALGEREALRSQLHDVTRRCQDLQAENERLRAEIARVTADHRQLQQGHADIVDNVGQFLSQLSQVLEPMRGLADKLGQARHPVYGAERAG